MLQKRCLAKKNLNDHLCITLAMFTISVTLEIKIEKGNYLFYIIIHLTLKKRMTCTLVLPAHNYLHSSLCLL